MCNEWTLPLTPDADLRLSNEARPRNTLPLARGHAEAVAPGSTLICPSYAANGLSAPGLGGALIRSRLITSTRQVPFKPSGNALFPPVPLPILTVSVLAPGGLELER